MKKLLLFSILCYCGAVLFNVLANASYPPEIRDDLRLLPTKEMAGIMSLDHRGAAADLLFTQVSIHSGSLMWKPLSIKFDSNWAFGMMDLATDLDPRYREAYLLSAMGLIHKFSDANLALPILRKGMLAMPDSWEMPYWYGYDHYFYLDDSKTASEYFLKAAQKPGAPKTNWGLLVNVSKESGYYENAYWALKVMYDNSDNEKVKMIYAKKLVQLDNLFTLQKAVTSYNDKTGNYPESLEKLVENGYIEKIPDDPMGKGYVWDGEKVTVSEE
jgi:tetratricopeptide (TPR) repeat protein